VCDPISLGGMLLSVAGSAVKAKQQKEYVNDVNTANRDAFDVSRQARLDEIERQRKFDRQGDTRLGNTTDRMTRKGFEKTRDRSAEGFMSTLDRGKSELTTESRLPGQEGASVAVQNDITKQVNSAAVDTRRRVQSLADLQGYGSAGAARGTNLGSAGDFLSILGGKRRGSLAVAQQEQTIPAAEVEQKSTIFGDLLSGIGGLAAGGGLSGLGLGGAAAAPASILRPMPNPFYQ
jgi:hypothetical protein